MRLRIIAPDGSAIEQTVEATAIRIGRDPSCEVAFDPAIYLMVSGRHARLDYSADSCVLTPLSQTNKTLLNDRPAEGPVAVKLGDRIRLGLTGPTIELVTLPEPAESLVPVVTPVEGILATVLAGPQHMALLRGSHSSEQFPVGQGGVLGREVGPADFVLDHPLVSRRHARLSVEGGRILLHDLGSANGTFVNGRRLTHKVELKRGDRIDVGPFSLAFDGEALVSRSRSNNIELVADTLRRVVKDRATGQPLVLLDDLSLVVQPREFVCLLGPSGSGKTTLLAMLSGRNPPNQGGVRVNGQELYENFAALKQDIAVVPQKDILHDSLAVGAALRYTAELRLPPDTGRHEIRDSVADILEVVGLSKRHATLIRHLSGGQVKRASLANELMARPSLLFLDEVTSGLDEQTDREMMELFRQVADNGKTVVCITHSLANVEATCHLVVILTEGGRLAFVGTPDEARQYFGIARLGDVYRKLAERPAATWQAEFQASPLYSRYVNDRLAEARRAERKTRSEVPTLTSGSRSVLRAPLVRQTWTLTRRYLAVWRGDPQALLAMLGQSLLVAMLLGVVFGQLSDVTNPLEHAQRAVNLLFLMNVSCFWFGCNNAAKELVKERVIYTRERDFNLRTDSYVASKFLVLVPIALAQVTLLFGVVRFWCGPPGDAGPQWLALAALAVAGTALGLLISAFAHTDEVAAALVPIAIIPQIILAGVIAPLKGFGKFLADGLITAHWGERSVEALLPAGDRDLLNLGSANYGGPLAMMGVHALVFVAGTFALLWWRGRSPRTG